MEIRIDWAPAESSWVSVRPEPLGCERGARALVRPGPAQTRGQMGLGLQEARVDSAKRFWMCLCTEGRNGFVQDHLGKGGQLQHFPWFLCVLRAFFGRCCLHPVRAYRPALFQAVQKTGPAGRGADAARDLSAAEWAECSPLVWEGGASPWGMTCVRTRRNRKSRSRYAETRESAFHCSFQAVPAAGGWCVCPSGLDASSADVALHRWGF